MEIEKLLSGVQDCPCGRVHTCDIQAVKIGPGAIQTLPEVCKPFESVVLVADSNTYGVCGDKVAALLGEKLEISVVFACDGFLIPDEAAIDRVNCTITAKTDLVLGIGSGVINDLCKYTSSQYHLPYMIVATAPSMDGYASVGAAMITGGMKTTFPAHVPHAIIGDVDILRNAPMRMLQSGFGDIIGKYSALNDWKLAQLLLGEAFCPYIYQLVWDCILETEKLAEGIQQRDEKAVQQLFEALVLVGIAMSFSGNSRPASGSEHHISHYFEITGIVFQREYLFHGIDVAYSTVCTQIMRERLLHDTFPIAVSPISSQAYQAQIEKYYGAVAPGVLELQEKCGYYNPVLEAKYRDKWPQIIEILREVPSSQQLLRVLQSVGLDYEEFQVVYGLPLIRSASLFAKDLKDRFTFLWIYYTLYQQEARIDA